MIIKIKIIKMKRIIMMEQMKKTKRKIKITTTVMRIIFV